MNFFVIVFPELCIVLTVLYISYTITLLDLLFCAQDKIINIIEFFILFHTAVYSITNNNAISIV